jgi:hypothetical protein
MTFDERKAFFSTDNVGTTYLVSNHWQRVCYRIVDSVCRSDAQGADATPLWNSPYMTSEASWYFCFMIF